MGGSPTPRRTPSQPSRTRPIEATQGADTAVGGGEGSAPVGGTSCPTGFEAEVVDIPAARQDAAAGVTVGTALVIALDAENDPAFMLDGSVLGWLAVNIEEVTECLQAGWRYEGTVESASPSAAGALIITRVRCHPPVS